MQAVIEYVEGPLHTWEYVLLVVFGLFVGLGGLAGLILKARTKKAQKAWPTTTGKILTSRVVSWSDGTGITSGVGSRFYMPVFFLLL